MTQLIISIMAQLIRRMLRTNNHQQVKRIFYIWGKLKHPMKNLLSSLLIFIGSFSASAQNIPNQSFETWHPYSLGEYPHLWSTSDSVAVALGGGTSVFKGTDPYEGALSLHMKSVTTNFGIIQFSSFSQMRFFVGVLTNSGTSQNNS